MGQQRDSWSSEICDGRSPRGEDHRDRLHRTSGDLTAAVRPIHVRCLESDPSRDAPPSEEAADESQRAVGGDPEVLGWNVAGLVESPAYVLPVDEQFPKRHRRSWMDLYRDLVSRSLQRIAELPGQLTLRPATRRLRERGLRPEAGACQVNNQWITATIRLVTSDEMSNDVADTPVLANRVPFPGRGGQRTQVANQSFTFERYDRSQFRASHQ